MLCFVAGDAENVADAWPPPGCCSFHTLPLPTRGASRADLCMLHRWTLKPGMCSRSGNLHSNPRAFGRGRTRTGCGASTTLKPLRSCRPRRMETKATCQWRSIPLSVPRGKWDRKERGKCCRWPPIFVLPPLQFCDCLLSFCVQRFPDSPREERLPTSPPTPPHPTPPHPTPPHRNTDSSRTTAPAAQPSATPLQNTIKCVKTECQPANMLHFYGSSPPPPDFKMPGAVAHHRWITH